MFFGAGSVPTSFKAWIAIERMEGIKPIHEIAANDEIHAVLVEARGCWESLLLGCQVEREPYGALPGHR